MCLEQPKIVQCILGIRHTHTHTNTHKFSCSHFHTHTPVLSWRSTRSALGRGRRAWRGERVLGVEAGELGSGGRSGGGYPLCTSTSEAHSRHTLCRQGSTTGCLTMPLHTGHCSSCSMFFRLDFRHRKRKRERGRERERERETERKTTQLQHMRNRERGRPLNYSI